MSNCRMVMVMGGMSGLGLAMAGRIVNISVNHSTMTRAGFVPYGPSPAGTAALSHIIAPTCAEPGSPGTRS